MIQNCETPQKAARRLANTAIWQGYKPEALHEYTDEQGNILYWRIRLKHPDTGDKWIRPMCFDSSQGYQLKEPDFPDGKPLYRLTQLQEQPKASVIVCEGEWCVDKLQALGVLAITSGSADSVMTADWRPLAGRRIILWPDNDEAGQRFAEKVCEQLQKFECTVQQIDIDVLCLPPKGDVVDWVAMNPQATRENIAKLAVIDSIATVEEQHEVKTEKISQASLLVDFVVVRAELFHDLNAEVYAQDFTTHETRRLDSRAFKDWLVANFYKSTGKSPRDQSVREALATLGGLARYTGVCREVNIRVAVYEGKYYLDLAEPGQSRAICIQAGDWHIISEPPVRFLRPETLRPLPEPVKGGDINLL